MFPTSFTATSGQSQSHHPFQSYFYFSMKSCIKSQIWAENCICNAVVKKYLRDGKQSSSYCRAMLRENPNVTGWSIKRIMQKLVTFIIRGLRVPYWFFKLKSGNSTKIIHASGILAPYRRKRCYYRVNICLFYQETSSFLTRDWNFQMSWLFIHCSYTQGALTAPLKDDACVSWLSAVRPHFFLENAHNTIVKKHTGLGLPLWSNSLMFSC